MIDLTAYVEAGALFVVVVLVLFIIPEWVSDHLPGSRARERQAEDDRVKAAKSFDAYMKARHAEEAARYDAKVKRELARLRDEEPEPPEPSSLLEAMVRDTVRNMHK
jgi:hypothetical protein